MIRCLSATDHPGVKVAVGHVWSRLQLVEEASHLRLLAEGYKVWCVFSTEAPRLVGPEMTAGSDTCLNLAVLIQR